MEKKKLGRALVILVVVPVLVKGLESTFAEPIKLGIIRGWNLIVSLCDWLTSPHEVTGWVLALLCVSSSMLVAGISMDIISANTEKKNKKNKIIFDYHKYTTDIFDGARWRWNYHGNSISAVSPYCPDCDSQLIGEPRGYSAAGINLFCERCNRIVIKTGMDYPEEIEARAKREIGRRIRMQAKEYTEED